MSNFLIVGGGLFAVVVLAGWPWIMPMLAKIGFLFVKGHRVLTWSAPDPKANGALLTFTGVEIGHRFVGVVTSQEAHVEQPKVVGAKSKIEVVSR